MDRRVDEMVERGLLREVRALMLLSQAHPTAMQAIGYKEIVAALRGETRLPDAILQMKQATRNTPSARSHGSGATLARSGSRHPETGGRTGV